jgi:hypothetical protein
MKPLPNYLWHSGCSLWCAENLEELWPSSLESLPFRGNKIGTCDIIIQPVDAKLAITYAESGEQRGL